MATVLFRVEFVLAALFTAGGGVFVDETHLVRVTVSDTTFNFEACICMAPASQAEVNVVIQTEMQATDR